VLARLDRHALVVLDDGGILLEPEHSADIASFRPSSCAIRCCMSWVSDAPIAAESFFMNSVSAAATFALCAASSSTRFSSNSTSTCLSFSRSSVSSSRAYSRRLRDASAISRSRCFFFSVRSFCAALR